MTTLKLEDLCARVRGRLAPARFAPERPRRADPTAKARALALGRETELKWVADVLARRVAWLDVTTLEAVRTRDEAALVDARARRAEVQRLQKTVTERGVSKGFFS